MQRSEQHARFVTARGLLVEPTGTRRRAFCEHTFPDLAGNACARLRRALDHRNTLAALSAAAELPHVGPAEETGRVAPAFRGLGSPRADSAVGQFRRGREAGCGHVLLAVDAAVANAARREMGNRTRRCERSLFLPSRGT